MNNVKNKRTFVCIYLYVKEGFILLSPVFIACVVYDYNIASLHICKVAERKLRNNTMGVVHHKQKTYNMRS